MIHSPAFGGRGYFVIGCKFSTGEVFNSTLGFPGEGPNRTTIISSKSHHTHEDYGSHPNACEHITELLDSSVSAVKTRLQAMTVSAELMQELLSFEQQGQKRKGMITLLQRMLRKIEKVKAKRSKDRHKNNKDRSKDRHTNPNKDRHTNANKDCSKDRHTNPNKDRHTNPNNDRHTNPNKDRHTNPNKDRHMCATNVETGTFRDFLWSHRQESALLASLCFAEEAREIGVEEADLNSMDDVDVVKIVRKYQSFIKSRSDGRVCGVCGVAGLEGRGASISLHEFKAWIVRSHSIHDDSMAATLKRKLDVAAEDNEYRVWREHLHVHTAHDDHGTTVEYILYRRGVNGTSVDVCSRCQTRTKDIRRLCVSKSDVEVYLSRFAVERQEPADNVIIMPAPECSFTQFDPGKLLQAGRDLSTLEKTAIAEFVVAGNVHKVRNARDVIAAYRISGHSIVFPIDTLASVASRTATLSRSDIADLQRVMWTGPPSSYAGRHAGILNLRKLAMRYSQVVDALNMLKIMHPRYNKIDIASKEEVKWEEQKQSVHKNVILRADGVREAAGSSDIAEGWDPKCRVNQSAGAPADADFGAVMILGKDGLKPDPLNAVKAVCKAVSAAKATKTSITLGSVPVNEYKNFAEILAGGFPVEFPLGVTADDIGGGGGVIKKNHLHRLMRFYDGRVAKNETLLMYLCNVEMRHSSQSNVTARVRKDSAAKLVNVTNSDQFHHDCAVAEKDPESEEAKELVKTVAPLIRLAGAQVRWGPLERLSATHHLYALYHTFGPPSFFVTFAPKTLTNELVLKFGQMQANGDYKDIDMKLPRNLQYR